MIPASFEYVRPRGLAEAVTALASAGEDAKVIAGGQSLLPLLRLRLAYPSTLVDLGAVDELRGIRDDGSHLAVGAMVTHHEVMASPLVREHAGLLSAATATVADPAIRHRGTFGGALVHADPAGDLAAVALAVEAELVVAGPSGQRTIRAQDFFVDYLQSALRPDEILVEIRIPKLVGWGFHYEKFHRVAQAWAIVGVAALVQRSNGSIAAARVSLTNMSSVPVRAHGVEAALAGVPAEPGPVDTAARHAAEGTSPTSDLHARADYREHLARVLTRRAVLAAAGV